jgi:tetratricopeptide (TPR) repeat protein
VKIGRRFIFLAALLAGAIIAAAAFPSPLISAADKVNYWNGEIIYSNATINERPVRVEMDTNNIGGLTLTARGAQQTGVKAAGSASEVELQNKEGGCWLIRPVEVRLGAQTFTAQFAVLADFFGTAKSWDIDGLVGWPGLRDNNILFFDSTRRTVSRLEQLPGETSGWLKLKIHPGKLLGLEVPLANGQTNVVLLDTGDLIDGVALPPARYQEWKSAHGVTPFRTLTYTEFGVRKSTEQAWAAEIKIGPITLTDLPVRPANKDEGYLMDNYAGVLGLYAFERMDLILDNENGYAYLRTKPPPGPPFPGVHRPGDERYPAPGPNGTWDWTVADNVRVSKSSLLFVTAQLKALIKDYQGAIADLNLLIEFDPNNVEVLALLGGFDKDDGDYDRAIADYTRVIGLDPKNYSAYLNRGVARQIQGDFAEALTDFDQATDLRPNDSTSPCLYRQALLRVLGRPPGDFAQVVAAWKPGWAKTTGEFLAGSLSEAQFLAAAAQGEKDTVRKHQGQAYYFVGLMRLAAGDSVRAREFFGKSVALKDQGSYEYHFAQAELARLGATNSE